MAAPITMETVVSPDGTPIAFERTGSGPSLVLVHGTAGDHSRWELFDVRPSFAEHYTVYAIDRRGRGESGDAEEYTLEREFEDVAGVVDSIDEPVALLGHSFGAVVALGAALQTDNLRSLVIYEPPIPGDIVGPNLNSEKTRLKMESLVADGKDEQALIVFMEDIGLSKEQIDELRAAPSWQPRVDAVHTVIREEPASAEFGFDAERFGEMTVPTMLLVGSESDQWAHDGAAAIDEVLPNSRIAVLEGQGHVAMNTAPKLFVDEVLAFVHESV